jgi:hypothetical protein
MATLVSLTITPALVTVREQLLPASERTAARATGESIVTRREANRESEIKKALIRSRFMRVVWQ